MDDDEIFALLATIAGAGVVLFRGLRLLRVRRAVGILPAALAGACVACAIGLRCVLRTRSAREVVGDGRYELAWLLIECVGHASEAITIDRDVAAGVRLAGALVAIAAILGRSVAGDYASVDATLRDFVRLGWPALSVAVVAGVVDRLARPTFPPSPITRGVAPAIGYVLIAGAFAWR